MPLAHRNCHMLLALLNVHTVAHLVSRVHKNCRSASMGVSEATSLSRCCSPPRMGLPSWKVWPLAIIPPGNTLDHLTLSSMSLVVHWAESSPSSTGTVCIDIYWYSLYCHLSVQFVLVVYIKSLHCAICHLKLGACEMSYIYPLSLWEESIFVWLLKLGTGQPPYASWWYCWVASWWMDGKLFTGCPCPHTMGPTLGTRFCCHGLYLSLTGRWLVCWAQGKGGQISLRLAAWW